jgi:hypothetical protein
VKKPGQTLPPDHPEAVAERLAEMERKIDRLRTLYESFFAGTDRRPPNTPRRELNRLMLETQQLSIRNAGLRFRFQTLSQRWTLYTTYWNRTLREIEAGTYRKDLAKAQRRLAQRGEPLTEAEVVAMGIPLPRAKAFVERQNRTLVAREGNPTVTDGTPPPPPPAPAPPPAAAAKASDVPGMNDDDIADLQRRYNAALAGLENPRPALTVAKLKEMLATRVPEILRQQAATGVRFDVATRDGKVVLRAKPIK